eukprot:7936-Heterococcus_DN1.PRE.7
MSIIVDDVRTIEAKPKIGKSYYSVAWLVLPTHISSHNIEGVFANKLKELIGHGGRGFVNIGGIGLHVAKDKFNQERVLIVIQVKKGKSKEFTDKSVREQLDKTGVLDVQLGELPELQYYPLFRVLYGEIYGREEQQHESDALDFERSEAIAAATTAIMQSDPQLLKKKQLLQRLEIVEQQLKEKSEKLDRLDKKVYLEPTAIHGIGLLIQTLTAWATTI